MAGNPLDETYRMQVIVDLAISGHDNDLGLEAILRTVAAACAVPITVVNIVTSGRQTYAAEIGLGQACTGVSDDLSFCAAVVASRRGLQVPDAPTHELYRDNPFVRSGAVGSYAGEPVIHRGVAVGSLAMFDVMPRQFTDRELLVLSEQARLVEIVLAMRSDAKKPSSAMLRSVVDNSRSLIYVKSMDGQYLMVNRPFEQAFSMTEAELLGQTGSILDTEMGPLWRRNDQRAVDGVVDVDEYAGPPEDRRVYESRIFPLLDAGGEVYATCGISVDVTARREAALALEEAKDEAMEASRQKSAFLATMSHEIRTPMNAVIGMTGLLLDTTLDGTQREFVETVRTSGDSLLVIINDILDFSKIEAGGLQLEERPFDLRSCIDDVLELVAASSSSKGLELIGHVDRRCAHHVVGDVTRLRQILVNLLGNAIKFTPNGEVVLTAEPGDGEGCIRIAVTDTGIGIPPDRLTSLFDSFSQVDASTTRKFGGTGLGLAISQRLVAAMGGALEVESVPEAGSTFHFSVTFGRSDAVDETLDLDPAATLDNLSALVVDDNRTNRRILRLQIEGWGMKVSEAESGDAALALVDSDQRFDIAVLDMKMPGMSGRDLATAFRTNAGSASLPLLLLSSREDRSSPLEGDDVFSAVLTKPVRGTRLLEVLREVLLPDLPSTRATRKSAADKIGSPTAPLRVLLAEDNGVNQLLGRLLLEKLGHHVDVVGDGQEAADAVRRLPYDVVLMDLQMPGMDGLEATRLIRSDIPAERQPKIVALTASVFIEDRAACDHAGMDDYLAKPVHITDLGAALARVSRRIDAPRPT